MRFEHRYRFSLILRIGRASLASVTEPTLNNFLRHLGFFLATGLFALAAFKASANGFALPSQDAFAASRGEAFVATADNPSAIYYNPAGITQLENNNLRAGLEALGYQPSFTPPAGVANYGVTYDEKDNFATIPQLFYTCSLTNVPVSFGLGVYAPFGGSMTWPQKTGFRSVAIKGSLEYLAINPVVAVQILPGLSIGGGPTINYSKIILTQGLRRWAPRGTNYFRFSGDGWSLGYNAGILWQPNTAISLGATIRGASRMEYHGRTDLQLQPGVYNTPQSRDARTDFDFPLTAVFGVSCRPTAKWNIEFDATYTGWDSFDEVTIRQGPPALSRPFDQNIPVKLGWQASWIYEFGVTRYFENGWQISAGYAFNGNSVPDQYYTPLAADLNRHFFSVGTGYKGKTLEFDIAYQFGYGPGHTVTGSQPASKPSNFSGENADGTYKFISHAVLLSVGWRF